MSNEQTQAARRGAALGGHAPNVDGALDRLEAAMHGRGPTYPEDLTTVRAGVGRLREERDEALARPADAMLTRLRELAKSSQEHRERAESAEAELRVVRANLERAEADLKAAREGLREIETWFQTEPWKGNPDPGSFGGEPYTEYERSLGYGSYRDPRFLPALLAASSRPPGDTEGGD